MFDVACLPAVFFQVLDKRLHALRITPFGGKNSSRLRSRS
jgi:hypothetical protein